MAETDVLTFEQLRNIRKKERQEDTLQELEDDFFEKASDYLARKKRKARGSYSSEYINAKHLVEDIIDSRQKKILRLAFLTNKSNLTVDNLLPEEEDLFDSVRNDIQQQRDTITQAIFDIEEGQETADSPEPGTDERTDDESEEKPEVGQERKETAGGPEESADDEGDEAGQPVEEENPGDTAEEDDDVQANGDDDMLFDASSGRVDTEDTGGETPDVPVEIELTDDVEAFMGVDMEEYGPFEEGETVELPRENADVLEQQRKARIIE